MTKNMHWLLTTESLEALNRFFSSPFMDNEKEKEREWNEFICLTSATHEEITAEQITKVACEELNVPLETAKPWILKFEKRYNALSEHAELIQVFASMYSKGTVPSLTLQS